MFDILLLTLYVVLGVNAAFRLLNWMYKHD